MSRAVAVRGCLDPKMACSSPRFILYNNTAGMLEYRQALVEPLLQPHCHSLKLRPGESRPLHWIDTQAIREGGAANKRISLRIQELGWSWTAPMFGMFRRMYQATLVSSLHVQVFR